MKISTLVLAASPLALTASIPQTKPQILAETGHSVRSSTSASKFFDLGQVENPRYKGIDAPAELLKAYAKYGNGLPPKLQQAVDENPELNRKFKSFFFEGEKSIKGTAQAFPPDDFDTQYVVPVQIGTPPQLTYLNLDTGSADFWTFTTDTYRPQVRGQYIYDPRRSNTSELQTGESWQIRYGDGAGASGIVYKDKVQIGDTSFDEQAVQSAVQVSSAISADSFSSGILGMGFGVANTVRPTKQKTYTENIKDQLAAPLFTVNLQKGRPGNYNFGYVNQSELIGPIGYASVESEVPYWRFNVRGYQVGQQPPAQRGFRAIADTGTTLLLTPEFILDDYYTNVKGSSYDPFLGMVTFPCNTFLPDFVVLVGQHQVRVPGSYINYGPASARPGYCYGGIQSNDGLSMAVFGDVLLKAQFVVFDLGQMRIGFADKPLV